jgi:ParB family chromosome partitioning protein
MNTAIKKSQMIVEYHCLDLPYAPIRFHKRSELNKLIHSIEQNDQLVPVVVVPSVSERWILMDGYLRIKALQFVGKDTANAEVWECKPAEALLTLLTEYQSRTWEIFEESLLLRELQSQYHLSQQEIATRIGRDRSWISRRLALIDHLPEPIIKAILSGKLSPWVAQRVLVPVARATPMHAELLLSYFIKNEISTREAQLFYNHYQRSNRQQRFNMVNNPELFFKAQKLMEAEQKAKELRVGPEGTWHTQYKLAISALVQLAQTAPQILFPNQALAEREQYLNEFQQIKIQFTFLSNAIQGISNVK